MDEIHHVVGTGLAKHRRVGPCAQPTPTDIGNPDGHRVIPIRRWEAFHRSGDQVETGVITELLAARQHQLTADADTENRCAGPGRRLEWFDETTFLQACRSPKRLFDLSE